MNGGNRELVIWGLILGLASQAIYEASRIFWPQYVRFESAYLNILFAVIVPIAVLYFLLTRERKRAAPGG